MIFDVKFHLLVFVFIVVSFLLNTTKIWAQTSLTKGSIGKTTCNDSTCIYNIKFSTNDLESLARIIVSVTTHQSVGESIYLTNVYSLETRDSSNTVYVIDYNDSSSVQSGNEFVFGISLTKTIKELQGKITLFSETKQGQVSNTIVFNTNEF